MYKLTALLAATVLSVLFPVMASNAPQRGNPTIQELPDAELGAMRGRYTVAGYGVAWFGVSMVSTWLTPSGQSVAGTLTVGIDFSSGQPKLVLVPSVTLDAQGVGVSGTGGERSVDASGLANVSGFTQAVQVAGDGNRAFNGMRLTIRDTSAGMQGPGASGVGGPSSAVSGAASAIAGLDGSGARLQLRIEGQGLVEQWLRSGSVGQSIQLTGDGQQASNAMNIELVRQPSATNTSLSQNVAQAIVLARGVGR